MVGTSLLAVSPVVWTVAGKSMSVATGNKVPTGRKQNARCAVR